MARLIECIPNFSVSRERDEAAFNALVETAQAVAGCTVLDVQSDGTHNRCVFTLVGSPEGIGEAAFRLAKRAMEVIDMTKHQGAHPRMGATDVIPFVPTMDMTMEECVELSRQGEGGIERFGSVPPARAIVRSAIALGRGVKKLIPARMLVRMNHQWDAAPQPLNPKDRVAFDLIRATVNLTVASLLIAWATGKQLPLSTTYVTFMVAMGSSLADKAWGRESAVYRVTGVLTVISGWFMTGLAAFTLAAVMATVLHYGQVYAIFGLLALVVVILVKSTIMHRKRENKLSVERFDQITEENILDVCSHQVVDSTLKLREIYNDTVENFFQGDRKALKELADAAERLALTSSEHHKYDILPILYKMQSRSLDMGYHFVQALEHLNEATQSLAQFSESIFTYVDNNHTPFTIDQVDDLKEVHTALMKLLDEYCKMLQTGTYIQFDYTMVAQEQLLQLVAKATKRQIKRAQRNQTRTRSSLLYLNMLNEMRFMAVQVRALTNDERNFVAA